MNPVIFPLIRYLLQQKTSLTWLATCEALALAPKATEHALQQWAGISPEQLLAFFQQTPGARLSQGYYAQKPAVTLIPWDSSVSKEMSFGFGKTPFGMALIAWSEQGICHLSFADEPVAAQRERLYAEWPSMHFHTEALPAQTYLAEIFTQPSALSLPLVVKGSDFRYQVWQALLNIPIGSLISYGALAKAIDKPQASRAVGRAVAENHIAWLIPCHRVVRANGQFGQYRWGAERKVAMQLWEYVQPRA